MKELGAILKTAREAKGISLDEVQMITKIRLKHLKALEAGDFTQLPGEVYVKGFLVNFAKAVDLDGDEILKKYYQLKNREEADKQEVEERLVFFSPNTVTQGKADSLQKKNPMILMGIVFGVLLIIGTILFFFFRGRRLPLTETEPFAQQDQQAEVEIEEQEPALPLEEDVKEEETVAIVEPILKAKATEKVWLGIYQQDKIIFEGTLYPQDEEEWLLTGDVTLRIGNAGGLRLTYKGEDFGELGYSGQVISKKITFND